MIFLKMFIQKISFVYESSNKRMTNMTFKAVIFDLDGTLLDTLYDLGNSMNNVLERKGFSLHKIEKYRYMIGKGVEFLVASALPPGNRDEASVKNISAEYRDEYDKNWRNRTKPYDGIVELINKLYSVDIKMAVLSNKPHGPTEECIREFLPFEKFDIILGQRQGTPPKPDPGGAVEISMKFNIPPHEFLYLGDTDVDMKTAVAAGMYPVGVLWGFRTAEELTENGAKVLINKPEELMELIIGC
jgi:phosphoglycolate phosphatase